MKYFIDIIDLANIDQYGFILAMLCTSFVDRLAPVLFITLELMKYFSESNDRVSHSNIALFVY